MENEKNIQKGITVILFAAVMVASVLAVFPMSVSAWGASVNVASVDDTCSVQTGCYDPAEYPNQTFTNVPGPSVSAAVLAGYDTVILWGFDPSSFSSTQQTDIVNWIFNGGKLIIWDSEDPYPGSWDYSWLPYPFVTSVPGAMGAMGYPLWIIEENTLSSNDTISPYYIDTNAIGSQTDAVGDANIFTAFTPDWCADMMARNYLEISGPTHVYAKYGTGIIIYCGLDFDYAGWGYPGAGSDALKKILRQELDTSSLPCGVPWTGNLNVTKTADKDSYLVGETITFTVTVENPSSNPFTAEDVVLTDYPPVEVSVPTTTYNLGDIPSGSSVTQTITGTAIANGTNITNKVGVVGYYEEYPVFSGSAAVKFVIIANQPPDCSEAYADPGCLWPPNHKFVDITIGGVTDPDGDTITITVTSITSDEPTASIAGAGGVTHAPDAFGVGTDTASVRAGRSGTSNGRVYEITFVASDGKGGECEGSVTVCVPHDRRKGTCDCIDDGQIYDATAIN